MEELEAQLKETMSKGAGAEEDKGSTRDRRPYRDPTRPARTRNRFWPLQGDEDHQDSGEEKSMKRRKRGKQRSREDDKNTEQGKDSIKEGENHSKKRRDKDDDAHQEVELRDQGGKGGMGDYHGKNNSEWEGDTERTAQQGERKQSKLPDETEVGKHRQGQHIIVTSKISLGKLPIERQPNANPILIEELLQQTGAKENPAIVPLQLKCAGPHFSAEEREFFETAALEGEIGQTHYTHVDAELCYRCPLRDRVLNPNGLARHTSRHFLMLHKTQHREYVVTLVEGTQKQIRIKTGDNAACRSGADPPSGDIPARLKQPRGKTRRSKDGNKKGRIKKKKLTSGIIKRSKGCEGVLSVRKEK